MRKKFLSYFILFLSSFVFKTKSVLAATSDKTVTCQELDALISKYWSWVLILAPAAVVILTTIDFVSCMLSSDKEALKKAGKKALNRAIALVLLLILPVFVNLLFGFFGIETCF